MVPLLWLQKDFVCKTLAIVCHIANCTNSLSILSNLPSPFILHHPTQTHRERTELSLTYTHMHSPPLHSVDTNTRKVYRAKLMSNLTCENCVNTTVQCRTRITFWVYMTHTPTSSSWIFFFFLVFLRQKKINKFKKNIQKLKFNLFATKVSFQLEQKLSLIILSFAKSFFGAFSWEFFF